MTREIPAGSPDSPAIRKKNQTHRQRLRQRNAIFSSLLNEISEETELNVERSDLFITFLSLAWDMLFLHEFAHIVGGHLRFQVEREEEFAREPTAYSRSFELAADDYAAIALAGAYVPNAPRWLSGKDSINGHGTTLMHCIAVCSSLLLLAMRIHSTKKVELSEASTYPPLEMRHDLILITILRQRDWKSQEAMNEAYSSALTDAVRFIDLIRGYPERALPTMFKDLGFEEATDAYSKLYEEHARCAVAWRGLGF